MMRIALSLFFILLFSQFACSPKFTQPELVSIHRVQVRNLNFEGMTLNFCAGVRNGNRYKIDIKGLDAEVYVAERFLGNIRTESPLVLDKKGISDMPLSLEVNFKGAIQNAMPLIEAFKGNKLIDIRLKGRLKVKVKGIPKEFPFDYQDSIKLSDLKG